MKPTCLGLVLVHSIAYYRGVLRGIRRYVEARPQWLLTSIIPEQQSQRVLSQLRPDGLIAYRRQMRGPAGAVVCGVPPESSFPL